MKCFTMVLVLVVFAEPVEAGTKANEVADFLLKRFGKEAVKEGAATLANRIEALAAKHGPDVYQAVTRAGPNAIQLLERAGPHGVTAAGILAKYGDEAAAVAARPRSLALISRHGDEAARALIRHKGIAEPIVEKFGQPGVQALAQLNQQNGRRLAMLLEDGVLAKTGRAEEVLGVIGKFGDRAMVFVWENKGALAIIAALTAFIARPELFISGAVDITKIAGENVARPLAEVPGKVAVEVSRGTNWTVVLVVLTVIGAGLYAFREWVSANQTKEDSTVAT